ncbi:hypothetical protein ANANG_G00227450 [Anguilla anguilla]|uniref:Agrin n=1 Tax=Anguilla anguilla TaxID=7936 RepID=A0A9D3RQA0_ANGAN|nr:hypothetical protein ANANG_G00227450 [Anguilla anguilla]
MTSCQYPATPPERERMYQHKVSLVVRYFMIPCNICLILLATSTLGFAVLLFLNNYKPVHFTPAQAPDGCRGMLCGFGAVCERAPGDPSRGACVCRKTACPSMVAPVCGSDDSTYSNECELEKAQCVTQRRLRVVRKGPCGLKDPCSEVTCSYGSTCVQASDGQSARCVCPQSCEGRPEQVVCGSDGQDYRSECELHKSACDLQRNVHKQHPGPCGFGTMRNVAPCKDRQNSLNSVGCRVEPRTRRPLTLPPESCPADAEPLCASDGHTYDSECRMRRTGMLRGVDLRKIHSGKCRKQEECREECQFNAVCLVERLGPRCSCEPIQCDGTYRPLCGKDGRTYANDCERQRAECQAKAHIPIKQQGPCDLLTPSPCLRKTCEFGAECVVKDGEGVPGARRARSARTRAPARARTLGCALQRDIQVKHRGTCGQPGFEMRTLGCALQRDIQVKHRGPCAEPCRNCSFGAICDGQTGRCVCPTECVPSHQPVCGTDGGTYSNECELHVRACTTQQDLRVAAQGECKLCGGAVCSWGSRCVRGGCECPQCPGEPSSPVCGSDGITYDSACELRATSCVLGQRIEVARAGGCDEECGSGGSGSGAEGGCEPDRCRTFGGSWDEDAEDDRCVCDFTCQSVPRSSESSPGARVQPNLTVTSHPPGLRLGRAHLQQRVRAEEDQVREAGSPADPEPGALHSFGHTPTWPDPGPALQSDGVRLLP